MKKLKANFKITSVRDYDKDTVLINTAMWEEKGRSLELFHARPKSMPLQEAIESVKEAALADWFGEEKKVKKKEEPKPEPKPESKEEPKEEVKEEVKEEPKPEVERVPVVKKKARKKRSTIAKKKEEPKVEPEGEPKVKPEGEPKPAEDEDGVVVMDAVKLKFDKTNDAQKDALRQMLAELLGAGWKDSPEKKRVNEVVKKLNDNLEYSFTENNELLPEAHKHIREELGRWKTN